MLDKKREASAAATSLGSASTASPAPSAGDDSVRGGPKGKALRADPKLLKPVTSGQTAIVEFVDESQEPALPPKREPSGGADGSSDAVSQEEVEPAPPPRQRWACGSWLREVEGLIETLASSLCTDEEGDLLDDEEALSYVRGMRSKDDVVDRLNTNGAVLRLAEAIWPKLQILQQGPATASELANKWNGEGAGDLLFGGLPAFFNGLEPRIGSPDPKVLKDMAADHQQRADSHVEFTTGNYSVVTTSDVEWKFVVAPETAIRWPIEARLAGTPQAEHMRKLLPAELLKRRMEGQNRRLEEIQGDLLTWAEVVGGRMYTGPLFQKYNGILRGLDSPVPFLKNSMIQMCTAKDVSESYMGTAKTWERANGTLPYEIARKELNFYTTTIHVINSCIVKMGKLTVAVPVYRGMSGRIFPGSFWVPNQQGVMGGVELAFMSTTPERSVAEQYSQDGFGIIVEIEQGMIDRGAEIAWLSQYPHETEILFAPLAALAMTETRIDTHPLNGQHIIVCKMRVSINLTNPTIEQVVAKRRKIVTDMGRGLLMEMRSTLTKKDSAETESFLQLMRGLMGERPLKHEATWYNDDACFQDSVNETLRLKREVLNVPTLETKKLEGDAVAQLLGETIATKSGVLELPSVLFERFHQLRALNLDGFGGVSRLPDSIGSLQHLHTLHLRECEKLLELPLSIGKLVNLSTLNLTSCKELKQLPTSLGKLVGLTSLDLGFCKALDALPSDVGKLTALQMLRLQQCSALTELPASLGQLQALRILNLYGCSGLATVPEAVGSLESLEELNMRSCSCLTRLPPTLGQSLPALTSLDLSMCKNLQSLPESLGQCHNLQSLFLGNCLAVPELPASITRLRQLHTLNLYNCGSLTFLHDNFQNAIALRVLSLQVRFRYCCCCSLCFALLLSCCLPLLTSDCHPWPFCSRLQGCEKLKEVPPSVAHMPALATLTLWNCLALETMPDLSQIPKLQLDGVPEQLADWEADQKRKRAEDAAAGRGVKVAVKTAATSNWLSAGAALGVAAPGEKKGIAAAAKAAMAAMGGGDD